jgi:signal transduction histidine kinase/ligand-binding sensor domain-containing protein
MRTVFVRAAWIWLALRAAWTFAAPDPLLQTLTGSSPDYVVTTWQMPHGLPSDRVRAVLPTRDSHIWVATFNGAAQFDGIRFRQYNEANTPALRNSLVNCLFEDPAARLWMGSDTGEITWRDQDGFHALAVPANWPSWPVEHFARAADGTLWVLNRDGWMLRIRNLESTVVNGGKTVARYSDLVSDNEGRIWAVRYGGVLMQLADGHEVDAGTAPPRTRGYRNIAPARRGGLWVRDGHWLRRWDKGEWVEDLGNHSWTADQAVVLYEATDGQVWVGTRDAGAFVVMSDGSEQRINRANGLAHDLISSINEDREGNIWIGTDGGGLGMLRRRALFMINPPDLWQRRAVLSVSPSRDGSLWIGTEGAGVYRLRDGQFTRLSATNSPTAGDVRTAVQDREGRLWVGTQGAGLLLGEGDQLQRLTQQDTRIIMPDLLYAIYEDRAGALWLGSQNGLLCLKDHEWSRLGGDLYRCEVRCLTETPDGTVWVGMRGGGLARYQKGKFTQYLRPQGLPCEYVWALFGDSDGSVWIGTPGAGLIRWRDGSFDTFTTRQGLPSDYICSIQGDEKGKLWIGSYAGIFEVAKSDLERCSRGDIAAVNCLVLDTSDGLSSLEMSGGNQPSACMTADGRLWFATSGGLAMVDPGRVRPNPLPPPVSLEEMLVDGKPLPLNGERQNRPGERVPPGSGQIEFRYTALSFCAPQRVRFRYRLENVDAEWVEAGTRRSAYYSRLRPGNYRFQVIACNNDGAWNEEGAVVPLIVLPFFWQTWWFGPSCWLFGALSLGGVVVAVLRRRHRGRIMALERARLLERERGRIARDLHDDLGSGLTDIGMTSALGQEPAVPAEEAREYFREIRQRSNEMVAALDEIVWAVNPKNDDLSSLTAYFSQFAEGFVRLTPVRCSFEIPGQLPRLALNAEHRHSLFLAFKEALQNTVTHSHATSLRVRISVRDDALEIILEDNGRGFPTNTPKAGADGLRNMRERLEQLGGYCDIRSVSEQGTRVTFVVPIKGNATRWASSP